MNVYLVLLFLMIFHVNIRLQSVINRNMKKLMGSVVHVRGMTAKLAQFWAVNHVMNRLHFMKNNVCLLVLLEVLIMDIFVKNAMLNVLNVMDHMRINVVLVNIILLNWEIPVLLVSFQIKKKNLFKRLLKRLF